ncbi:RHS repeat domain-containing protein [Planctomycetota bacterium]
MKNRQSKYSSKLFLPVFLILALVLTGLSAAGWIKLTGGNRRGSLITAETLDQIRPDAKTTQQYLGQYRRAADQLARNNSFVPPTEPKPPGDCTAIFGDEAFIGGRWVKAGDTLGDAKVLDVGPTAVTLQWEGKRITRSPVLVATNTSKSSSRNRSSNKQQADRAEKLRDVEAQIKAAVAAGKLSRQDAALKIEAINKTTGDSAKPEFSVITSVYDARGNLNEQTYNDGTRVLYDTAGNVTEKISADGTVWRARDRL